MKYKVKARRAIVVYEERTMEIDAQSPALAKGAAIRQALSEPRGDPWKPRGVIARKVSKIEVVEEPAP